jgi:malonyl-CoA O-methyltransferase
MAERLALIRRKPQRVVDWWAHAGGSDAALRAALPDARIECRGPLPPVDATPMPWWRRFWNSPATGEQPQAPADLVWANMLLQHESDPMALMRQWHTALGQQGFLMFSTLGPGSLTGLRSLYRSQGWGPPMADLVDMHDIGDMLVEAGFADPVMDQEIVRLTWSSPEAALQELHGLGSNANPVRWPGLRTPRWKHQLTQALMDDTVPVGEARVVMEFELVYGHAFKPLPRHPVAAETRIDLEDLRSSLIRKGKQS